ncbi:PfkB family carbohydrate kinase [Streptosporangium sp. NPDC023615]|uniref:PfkB family carbohydrate kinase n=1 Tax=Streptosporangium sp. NPDC023615 TaxID=3154794 RepID=UPI003418CDEE
MRRAGPLVVVGDTVLDVDVEGETTRLCPDAPVPVVDVGAEHLRPGGAGLAALLAARSGAEVVLVTALADDHSGRVLAGLLTPHLGVVRSPLRGTTVRKTRVRVRGRTLVRLDTGDGTAPADRPGTAARVLRGAGAVLVSDYGRGVADAVRDLLGDLGALGVPVVWDPHPRGAPPPPGCTLVTPNETEAAALCGRPSGDPGEVARHLVAALRAEAVAVTLGARGAVLAGADGHRSHLPAPPPPARPSARSPALSPGDRGAHGTHDTCGAGDRLAGAAALALREGAAVRDAVAAGVREAARFVNDGGAASIRPVLPRAPAAPGGNGLGTAPIRPAVLRAAVLTDGGGAGAAPAAPAAPPGPAATGAGDGPRDALETAEAVRARGGRLIATGGCFDLLHAGHVSLLRRARALGDALVVCVNSDASVRRLKGPGRPVVGLHDRVEVLRALGCVDAVLVFEEDTPCAAVELLRPEVWVKGGDHGGRVLPETAVLDRLGAEVVVLSRVPGRSTTGLIAAAQAAS